VILWIKPQRGTSGFTRLKDKGPPAIHPGKGLGTKKGRNSALLSGLQRVGEESHPQDQTRQHVAQAAQQ
jgi:hypothetical protein